jgi:tetratricopeptide (TPR) repeat protein
MDQLRYIPTTYLLFVFSFFCMAPIDAQRMDLYFNTADSARDASNYRFAIQWYKNALKISEDSLKSRVGKMTDLSSCYAKVNMIDSAFFYLEKAIYGGYSDFFIFNSVEQFYPMMNDRRWTKLSKKMDSLYVGQDYIKNNKAINKKLMLALRGMFTKDQFYRKLMDYADEQHFPQRQQDSILKVSLQVDSCNQIEIAKILDKYGYPGKTLVGRADESDAFFIIQHSSISLQEKYFALVEAADKMEEFSRNLFPAFVDKLRVHQGKKQLYGTQAVKNMQTGKWEPAPMGDLDEVNSRRSKIGWPPLKKT